ncbi:MAG: DNA-binding transcriptional MerR regulator, partial [Chitinophagales bacterium]
MPYIQKEIKKLYYSIGEVATLFDVNASLIRFWEKEFEIIKPHKNKKGNRMFTQKDV